MNHSNICNEFYKSLELSIELINLDNYSEPPAKKELSVVQGIRGGATILTVAAFEQFLAKLPETYLKVYYKDNTNYFYSKYPQEMQIKNIYRSLEISMRTPKGVNKVNRLSTIHKTMQDLLNEKIIPGAFIIEGNPRSDKVVNIYRLIDIDDVFKLITNKFQKKWGKELPTQVIKDKLDEIVDRRNRVAHTSNVLGITKRMLRETTIFLLILTELLDEAYSNQVEKISKISNIP